MNIFSCKIIILIISFSTFLTKAQESHPSRLKALVNYKIITLKDEQVQKDKIILLKNGKIFKFISEKEFDEYQIADSLIIDGHGQFLMPSFSEMHAHLQPKNPFHKQYLKDFLGYGITRIRVMAGNENLLAWRDSISEGLLMGPELKVAGPLIDGTPPLWGKAHDGPVVDEVNKVDSVVRMQKSQGYDFIKLYERLPADVYFAFLKAAEKYDIKVAAHIPLALLSKPVIKKVFNKKSPSFEHLKNFGPFVTCSEIQKVEAPDDYNYYGTELCKDPDAFKVKQVVYQIKANNIWICPTSVLWKNSSHKEVIENLIETEAFARMDRALKNWWLSSKDSGQRNIPMDELSSVFLEEMARQKVKVLAGTDFPNPFLIPGLSLHQEMQNLVKHGFSNLEALRAATIYPAQYWEEIVGTDYFNSGGDANFVILKKNPLKDIRNTLSIEKVIFKGKFFQPKTLFTS
ncbi:hypothetical protein C7S20_09255 [Christiangramia fulva]|uniref:Amidohydrolase-related domain-containing protein n=1 Tax=Christiangramia fulva TaxID=2126553 RepID=A0A2R3Z5E9_9FLAO|nr:amidohydrolase family protein [Christiangramia fulva]AVR45442.1 hypothetical protein C7S20_09255 [Christiangramia fulva]